MTLDGISRGKFVSSSWMISSTACSISFHGERPLLARLRDAAEQLVPVKRFAAPVALDHADVRALDLLVRGEAEFADEHFPASPDRGTVLRKSGIDYFVFDPTAFWAAHGSSKLQTPAFITRCCGVKLLCQTNPDPILLRKLNPRPLQQRLQDFFRLEILHRHLIRRPAMRGVIRVDLSHRLRDFIQSPESEQPAFCRRNAA